MDYHGFLETEKNARTGNDHVSVHGQEQDQQESKHSRPPNGISADDESRKAANNAVLGVVNGTFSDILAKGKDFNEKLSGNKCPPSPKAEFCGPEPIAIVGVSCRFPDSNSVEEFWELIIAGENGIRPRPKGRWTREQGCVVEDTKMEAGFLKCPVDEADASFFGYNPMELKYTDPQQRLLLEVAYEALEDAGISAQSLLNRLVGVFTGFWTDDYKELMIKSGFKGTEFYRSYLGNAFSASSGRLSQFLGVRGPNIASGQNCSASFAAVRQGVIALRAGEVELCIASAVNLILKPFNYEDFKAVVSPDSRCKTFDASANGFARAEGVASLVLKRLSSAIESGDRIYGVIRGMGMTQEGASPSMGTPTVDCEALCIKMALNNAQADPADVDYVEAHGTGTIVGDPIEVKAITKAYAGAREKPLLIGSVKTNVGHTESAAGMASIIKVLLAFKHEILPPHRNLTTMNPNIDLSCIPAKVILKPTPWKKTLGRKRIAGISCFGFSGGDIHMILEEPPTQPPRRSISNSHSPMTKLITLSAKNVDALNMGLSRLEEALNTNLSLSLDDVAYTLNTGRSHYKYRIALVVKDASSISKAIADETYTSTPLNWSPKTKTRVGFLFPGQGTQYDEMGKELTKVNPVFRHHFDLCCSILQQEHGVDLKDLLWTQKNLDSPLVSQVAIFVVEYATAQLWAHWGVTPNVVVGHSLGEFVAAVIADVMSLKDALKLVVSRCRLVQALPEGGMAVVRMDASGTAALLNNFESAFGHLLDIAAINATSQTTVSGTFKGISDFVVHCKSTGVTVSLLSSTVAYHSALIEPILEEFESLATTITYSKPCCTFISSVTGLPELEFGAKYWVKQTRNSVQFLDACASLLEHADVFVDLGPHPILLPLLLNNVSGINAVCLPSLKRNAPPIETLSTSLAKLYTLGIDVDWIGFHKFLPGEKVALPHYAFQRKKYWFNVDGGDVTTISQRMGSNGKDFPILGWELSTPFDKKLIYFNHLSLKIVPYVAEHKIGEHAIFPGAAYVEMFLEALTKLGYPLVVRNIRFLAPLVLTKDRSQETYTVLWRNSGKAKIFCRHSKYAPWVCHAEAELSPENASHFKKEEIPDVLNTIYSSTPISTDTGEELYSLQAGHGYNFGIKFQTIRGISAGPLGRFLVEIAVPPSDDGGHICHPIAIDSMLQAFGFTRGVTSLRLPSGIGHFEIVSQPKGPLKYILVTPNETILIDATLSVVALMKEMETMPASLERIESFLHQNHVEKTTRLFEEYWIPSQTQNNKERIVNNDDGRSWILFSDGTTLAKCICSALTIQGKTVVDVNGTEGFNAGRKSDVKKVFETVERLKGVIYMLGTLGESGVNDVWKSYLFIIQELASRYLTNKAPLVAVITRGLFNVTDQTPEFPVGASLSGMTRTFLTEFSHFTAKIIDLDPDCKEEPTTISESILAQLSSSANGIRKEVLVAFRDGVTYNARIRPFQNGHKFPPLQVPNGPFCLQLANSNAIADLKFTVWNPPLLLDDQVEIKIRAIGLNFRDIYLVFRAFAKKACSIGSDISGEVTRVGKGVKTLRVGDAVFGARGSDVHFASTAIMQQDELLLVPEHMTFGEAATYPIPFSSVYYGLVMMAKIRKDDNILIHSATGGVGLHALALAFREGATVFVTAGSRRKREYLRSIGVQSTHIFNSRNTNFKDEILALGGGQPLIDIVLNSITGPGFKEASLAICRNGAKFIELSVLNTWSEEEVKLLRPDVLYVMFNVSDFGFLSSIWGTIRAELNKVISNRNLQPIPVTSFQAEYIRDALTFLKDAKHIGKIVCNLPVKKGAKESPLFNERSLYLIVGGLGGIGMKVAEWMISKGAKHIALAGRRVASQAALQKINEMNKLGASVFSEQLNVSCYEEVSNLILKFSSDTKLPILRGVMNCAVTLDDAGLLEQNEEKYEVVLGSKIQGSWNLHVLTKHLPLEHFVMFSSFAAVVGSPGQSSYAAGNSFKDALAAYRHNSGLPATCVNWGHWGEVGVAGGQKIHGYVPMTTAACLVSLETILTSHVPNVIAVDGNHVVWERMYPWTETYFEILNNAVKIAGPMVKIEKSKRSANFWKKMEEANGVEEKTSVVRSYILSDLSTLMDQSPEEIHADQDLRLDSLMSIELRNSLQLLVGSRVVVPNTLASNSTLQQLTETIVELTMGKKAYRDAEHDAPKLKIPFSDVVRDGVKLALAPWKKFKAEINPKLPVSEIGTVLLTGVTGNFGPYVLLHLTQRPKIQVVHCLVQASDEAVALERVKLVLRNMQLLPLVDMKKVKVVVGNLAKPKFGVSNSIYDELASSVDAVFNIAAVTGHLEDYESNENNIVHQVNVLGVREVLLFATTLQAKYVYQTSTFATVMRSIVRPNGQKVMQEGWVADDEFDDAPKFGYIMSKFVADKVIEGFLRQVGPLPVKVFRIPMIAGCSTRGSQDVHKNHFFLKYLYYIKSGVMPRDDYPIPILPVDTCSLISLHIFFNEEAPSDVYTIMNPNAPSQMELPKLVSGMGLGEVKVVDYDDWVKLLRADKKCLLGALKLFYTDPERYLKLKTKFTMVDGWKNNRKTYFRCSKAEKYASNFYPLEDSRATLKRDIEYALKMIE